MAARLDRLDGPAQPSDGTVRRCLAPAFVECLPPPGNSIPAGAHSTNASTRNGLPLPWTILSGAAITTL